MAIGLVNALYKYFNKKEGQSLQDFSKEFQALTDKDKAELAQMLSIELGEEVVPITFL